ncbi:PHB2 [Cordylochernes scorpioides]|uniref:PHB2 n=1 Tax=Cordylochernes scorpioides TaxID=51811 RepID=A0ABY6LLF4_9ARAC|nr:PHB2 [Cordylochernes scorpioides]
MKTIVGEPGTLVISRVFVLVEGGHRAIIFNRIGGVQSDIYSEGLHFKIPWLQYPIIYDIRAKPRKIASPTGSKDLQMVNISLRVLARPEASKLPTLYRMLGTDYDERVLPSICNEVMVGSDSLYCKYITCLHSAVRPRVARAPECFASGGRKVSRMATNFIRAESPSKAEQKPVRHGSLAQQCAELSANQDLQNEIPIVLRKNQNYVNPPAGGQDANSAAPVDLAAIPTSNAAAQVRRNWADITEEVNPGAEEGFTLVQGRKRRRGSGNSPTTAAPSSNAGASRTIRRPQSSAGSVPRAQEIRATRAHIADARARQASSSEEHCVYIEHSPELEPFHYLRALDRMLGGTAGVIQITKVNGHQLLGLTNRGLAERLISEGLEVEGTLLRAFPFRKRAERITVGNLPFFVADSAVITALSPYGRVTSIAPKQMKAGPYVYVDGRRDVFITLHEGITIERLPTRLDINIKGQAWPAYLSSGIRCSRCHGQGHRRAICPLLAGLANNTRTAPPTTPAGVPPPTTPAPPQRSAAQPPAPAPSNLAMEVCSAPPMARAVLHPSAPRPSPPATPALPMEETPTAPPPVIPAPSLQVPKNPVDPRSATPRHPEPTPPARPDFAAPHGPPPIQETLGPAAPTQDVEMSIVEETTASSASSTRNATGDDLVAFIEGNPSVSFVRTDALGLGREEVLDLLSSRTKAQRNGPLLSPPQCDALVGLIGQILDLKPGHTSNLYKVLGQVRAELTKTPAAAPTPPLPAPRPTGPTPPVPHEEQMTEEQEDVMIFKIFRKLKHMTCLRPIYDTGIDVIDLKDAILFTEDTASLMTKLSPALKGVLAEFLGAAIELARSYHHDVLKSVVAKFNASQLITQRQQVSLLVRKELTQRALDFNIILDDVSLTELSFGREYTAAVESKQVAQQEAQRAAFVVEQAKQTRKQKIVQAEGEAKAATLISF